MAPFPASPAVRAPAAIIGGALVAALALRRRRAWWLLLPLAAGTGWLAATAAWSPAPLHELRATGRGLEGPWRARATVLEAARPRSGGASFPVAVRDVRVGNEWRPLRGVVEIGLPSLPREPPARGAVVETFLRLREDRPPALPGISRRDRLGVRGIDLRASLKSEQQIRVRRRARPVARSLANLRAVVRQRLATRLERSGEARALVLGERGGMDDASLIRLARSGLIHLFAISGLHVGLLALGAAGLVRAGGGSPRGASIGALAAVGVAAVLVAPAAPIRRAAVMTAAIAFGPILGRRHDAATALALALAALVILEPRSVHAPGFQMSALATTGLVLTFGGEGVGLETAPRPGAWLAASMVAQAWVAPVIAAAGAPVPLAAIVLNVFALPLLVVALLAMLPVLVAPCESCLPVEIAAALVDVALDSLDRLATIGAEGPAAPMRFGLVAAGAWWGALLGLAGAARGRRGAAGALLLLVGLLASRPPDAPEEPWLHVLDVGQGDALLLRTAPGALLMDAGGYPGIDYDVGAHLVLPAAARLGVDGLDAVAMSHAHADHAGGLATVADRLGAREAWLGVTPPADPYVRALGSPGGGAPALLLPRGPARPIGRCSLRSLLPPPPVRRAGLREVHNEASLVLVARCGAVDVWLTGDAGTDAEPHWPVAPVPRTLLKVGHHGSASATSERFLDRLRPRHAVISVGARNSFGLPRAEVLHRIRERGIALYRTDRDGSLHFRLGRRVRVRGERWSSGEGR